MEKFSCFSLEELSIYKIIITLVLTREYLARAAYVN